MNQTLRITATVLGLGLALGMTAPAAAGDAGWIVAERLRGNVVAVTAQGHGEKRTGFGFVVSESAAGKLVIVTADHVARSQEVLPEPEVVSVTVRFLDPVFGERPATLAAQRLDARRGDLAVLLVDKPTGFTWEKRAWDTRQMAPPEPVRYIGRQGKWDIPPDPLKVMGRQTDKQKLELQGDVQRGTSGAPLLSDRGIVGMVVQDETGAVLATEASLIKGMLAGWGYSWLEATNEDQRLSWLVTGEWKARKGETDAQFVLGADGSLDAREQGASMLGLQPGQRITWAVKDSMLWIGLAGEGQEELGKIVEAEGDRFMIKMSDEPTDGGGGEYGDDEYGGSGGDDDDTMDEETGGGPDDSSGGDPFIEFVRVKK